MAQHGVAGRHGVVRDIDFGIGKMVLQDSLDDLAILFAAATRAVIMDGLDCFR